MEKNKKITYKDLQELNGAELEDLRRTMDREIDDRKMLKDLGGIEEVIYADDGCEGFYFRVSELDELDDHRNAIDFIRYILETVMQGSRVTFYKTERTLDDDNYTWTYRDKSGDDVLLLSDYYRNREKDDDWVPHKRDMYDAIKALEDKARKHYTDEELDNIEAAAEKEGHEAGYKKGHEAGYKELHDEAKPA